MRKYYRNIIFSKTPLKSQFRYKDLFQILPIISGRVPMSPHNRHFPLLIEYFVDYDENHYAKREDILDDISLQEMTKIEIMNLLSVLSNHRFFSYNYENHQWAIMTPNKELKSLTPEEKDIFNNQYSSWTISGFIYPGLRKDLFIDELTENIYPQTELVPLSYYYFTDNPFESKDKEITFPPTIESCLDNYFQLSIKTQKRIKSAVTLICDGIDISDYKRSLSFLAYVSAIETMVGLEYPDNEIEFECSSCQSIAKSPYVCQTCGKPIWGIKTKFKEYLRKFVADGEKSLVKFNKIYNLRCKIAHDGQIFLGDLDFSLYKSEKKENEWLMKSEALQMARIALTNWLRYPEKASR